MSLEGLNIESENDGHMHEARITLIDDNDARSEWFFYEGGKNTYTAAYDLTRRSAK